MFLYLSFCCAREKQNKNNRQPRFFMAQMRSVQQEQEWNVPVVGGFAKRCCGQWLSEENVKGKVVNENCFLLVRNGHLGRMNAKRQ